MHGVHHGRDGSSVEPPHGRVGDSAPVGASESVGPVVSDSGPHSATDVTAGADISVSGAPTRLSAVRLDTLTVAGQRRIRTGFPWSPTYGALTVPRRRPGCQSGGFGWGCVASAV